MEAYVDSPHLWDLSHASSFSQLADDDFLALLQKQFPTGNANIDNSFTDGVNPQNITRYSLPSITPPSEDSSPSPPNMNNEYGNLEDSGDPALKRKASDEDFDEGPSSKSQHTQASGSKKQTHSRRKSTGTSGPPKDETRLLKRKEQNRAAQRAFRERKEKHVKDLEDKVAALEAKNEQAMTENENLRDLLARLRNENMSLKQSSFTFSVPKNAASTPENAQVSPSFASHSSDFASSSRSVTSPVSSTASPSFSNPLEWSSLTTFDPAVLNLLDDNPQHTATDGAMQMDFGFGGNPGSLPNTYTTIASNPMFMSFASTFDTASPPTNDANNSFHFDMNNLTSWPSPPQNSHDTSSLDELLAGYMTRGSPEYPFTNGSSASESPVTHHKNVNNANSHHLISESPSSSSSPSSSISDALFDTPRDSSASDSDVGQDCHNDHDCPKTKADLVKRIENAGPSPFAPSSLRKSSDSILGTMINCEGTSFPKTQKSDQNIEVLSAWRSITSNPRFKDVDINDLCTEFTSKAKCDGTKVVLEPHGVNCILQNLSTKK